MNIEFTAHGWEDFSYWIENDESVVVKIKELLKSIRQEPFKGIGKPEPLKFGLKGFWSRRITGEHRLVYTIRGVKGIDLKCIIIQCRFHYDDIS
jgi:toxin YoeB